MRFCALRGGKCLNVWCLEHYPSFLLPFDHKVCMYMQLLRLIQLRFDYRFDCGIPFQLCSILHKIFYFP